MMIDSGTVLNICSGFALQMNKMTPLKIHNCASYALMEYLTCWKCVIFHAVTASCYSYFRTYSHINYRPARKLRRAKIKNVCMYVRTYIAGDKGRNIDLKYKSCLHFSLLLYEMICIYVYVLDAATANPNWWSKQIRFKNYRRTHLFQEVMEWSAKFNPREI